MYQIAKKTLVDLEKTQIYLLKTKKGKSCIEVKLVFSVDKEVKYYKEFLKETLKFTKPRNHIVTLEDYNNYLADNCSYDLIENKITSKFTRGETTSALYLSPSPHSNLLYQSVNNLIEYNNTTLKVLPSGLFVFHEFLDNSNSVKGIVKDLDLFKKNKKINTITTRECWLLMAIKSLAIHWN